MINKKNLLIVNGAQFGYSAGHYFYCKYLKDEYQIEYICFDRGFKKLNMDGIKVNYIPFGKRKLKRTIQFIKKSIFLSWQIKPQVLFVVYFDICFLLALFGKGQTKIVDIRTGSLIPNPVKRKWANRFIKFQSSLFNKVIILSESLRDYLKINNSKTLILPLGSEVFYEGTKDYSNLHLLYVGTLNNRRVDDTIEGLALFLAQYPESITNIKYTIVGFGSKSELQKLNNVILKYNLQNIVSFEGRKNYNELPVFFEKANIGVAYVPLEEYYQRQPVTKIFEYGLSGLFTIATETRENTIIIDKTNGVLCKDSSYSFADAMKHVYHSRQSINSSEIRSAFQNYKWENLVKYKLLPFIK